MPLVSVSIRDVSPDFSKAFTSSSESIVLIKKRSIPLHRRHSEDVNFSTALNDTSINSFARPDEVSFRRSPRSTSKSQQAVDFCKAFQTNSDSIRGSETSSSRQSPDEPKESNLVLPVTQSCSTDNFVRPDKVTLRQGRKSLKSQKDIGNFSTAFQVSSVSIHESNKSSEDNPAGERIESNRIDVPMTSNFSVGDFTHPAGVNLRHKSRNKSKSQCNVVNVSKVFQTRSICTLDSKKSDTNQSACNSGESSVSVLINVPVTQSSSSSTSSTVSSRRCSTPVRGMSQRTQEDDLDLSYILPYEKLAEEPITESSSRPLPNKECPNVNHKASISNSLSHSLPHPSVSNVGATKKEQSQGSVLVEVVPIFNSGSLNGGSTNSNSNDNFPSQNDLKKSIGDDQDKESILSNTSDTLSFVTRTFHAKGYSPERNSSPVQPDVKKRIKIDYEGLPRRPKFPKFEVFCNKRFYQYLLLKMEHKYGIKTNRMVVKLAKQICEIVNNVMTIPENHDTVINDLKMLLFRRTVVHTHLEFFEFCQKFLPAQFARKAVPMIQPAKIPMIEFDWRKICDPIA